MNTKLLFPDIPALLLFLRIAGGVTAGLIAFVHLDAQLSMLVILSLCIAAHASSSWIGHLESKVDTLRAALAEREP